MTILSRLLLLVLVAALLGSTWFTYRGTVQVSLGHDTFYHLSNPWVHDVRQVSLFAVLGWSILFARRDPLFVRLGLLAVIAALGFLLLPPKTVHSLEELKPSGLHWH